MCGIAGLVDWSGDDHADAVGRMCQRIVHRGPDDVGVHAVPGAAVGMRRLSIIDLAGGHQPMFASDESLSIVFNGEIYNHCAIRSEHEAKGTRFRTRSDTEVIIRGFEYWGSDVFDRLDGMFAVALLDLRARRLILARDRVGEKPLYVWRRHDGIAFASEPKCFEAIGDRPALDAVALDLSLCLGYIPGPRTAWRDISRIEPGCVTSYDADLVASTRRYWSFPRSGTARPADPIAALDAELSAAVTSRLIADVEVGVLLSGGIDSSLIAHAAAAVQPGIKTFSVSIGDEDRSEARFARIVAEQIGSEHHELRVEAATLLDRLDEMVAIADEPFADSSILPTLIVAEFAAERTKVVLSGDGGDELLSGYPRYDEPLWLRATARLPTALAGSLAPLGQSSGTLLSRIGNAAALAGGDGATRYLKRSALLTPTAHRHLTGRDAPYLPPRSSIVSLFDAGYADGARRTDFRRYLPDDLLTKVDRASMAVSLEVRSPFLARQLIEWSANLAPEVLGPPGTKALGRDLARRHLGSAIADKPKQGFSIPMSEWLCGDASSLLDDLAAVHDHGLVRRQGVDHLRRRLQDGRPGAAGPLWAVIALDRWLRRWT